MIVQSKKVWIGNQFVAAQLELEAAKIVRIYEYGAKSADIDYGSRRMLPGFIDVHTHGSYGFDTNDAEPEGLRDWMKRIPEEGVTGVLPTTVTQMPEVLMKAVTNVADVIEAGYEGAEILGIHFEGPYLDLNYKGAQPPEAIAKASVAQFEMYQKAAKGWIRYITLAPEHDEDFALTRYCSEHGVVVSMGHSGGSYEEVLLAVANGATSMTHVYNGMSPLQHRNPGMVGGAFRIRDIFGEIICDGCHSHLASINNYFTAKGRDYSIMITDSLRVKCCSPKGNYELGGHAIEIGTNGLAYLKGTETIAGSTLKMNEGLRILIEEALVPMDTAINSCTLNPARCLRVDDRKGRLVAGYDADIVILEDNYQVYQTYCRGTAML